MRKRAYYDSSRCGIANQCRFRHAFSYVELCDLGAFTDLFSHRAKQEARYKASILLGSWVLVVAGIWP
jgi:hypothetical protein